MKRFFTTFLLISIFLFSLTGCTSKIENVKKAFEDKGYTWTQIEIEDSNEEAETELVIAGLYTAQKGFAYAVIIELEPNKDAYEAIQALKDDPDLNSNFIIEAVLDVYKDLPLTYGNCALITISSDAISIFEDLKGE